MAQSLSDRITSNLRLLNPFEFGKGYGAVQKAAAEPAYTTVNSPNVTRRSAASPTTDPGTDPAYQSILDQIAASDARIAALRLGSRPAPPPRLPDFNVEDVYKQARDIATSKVSPFYEKTFQLFKQDQAKRRGRAEEDTSRITQQAEEDLQTALRDIEADANLSRERTTQDAKATSIQDARGFSRALNVLRENQAQGNLTFSGIGQQQTAEAVQGKSEDERLKDQLRTRTFEDIARSESRARERGQKETARTVTGAKRNLERFITDLVDEEVTKSRELEFEKQQQIDSQTGTAAQQLFNRFLSTLRSPEEVAYANQLYGGSF